MAIRVTFVSKNLIFRVTPNPAPVVSWHSSGSMIRDPLAALVQFISCAPSYAHHFALGCRQSGRKKTSSGDLHSSLRIGRCRIQTNSNILWRGPLSMFQQLLGNHLHRDPQPRASPCKNSQGSLLDAEARLSVFNIVTGRASSMRATMALLVREFSENTRGTQPTAFVSDMASVVEESGSASEKLPHVSRDPDDSLPTWSKGI
ncbi:hypothetical protein RRG08_001432 [Elysia crispata]|uniref:Uncharacterized protein n=1 Tax=Elysia crispata TaxID=231223 RepID=A0AAE0ZR02_9GAST|nr:hypothetical protein RRG08_001432 [Elysia crispata]